MHIFKKTCFDEDALYWLSTSSGVRVTDQGFLFLDETILMNGPSYPCPRVLGALCQFENYTFLPCTASPLTRVTDAQPPFDKFWYNEPNCQKMPSLYDMHITPCDLQRGTSLLWANGTIMVQFDTNMNDWACLFSLLIMIWLIVNLGETLALIMEVKNAKAHNHSTVILSIILTVIVIMGTQPSIWVTDNDLLLYWCTLIYIWLYCLYHLKNPNTVNIIIGCLILISARFYQTNETPYVETFLFLIAARLSQKVYLNLALRKTEVGYCCWTCARYAFMLIDLALFVLLYLFAVIPSHKEQIEAHLELLGILYSSILLGIFSARYAHSKAMQQNK